MTLQKGYASRSRRKIQGSQFLIANTCNRKESVLPVSAYGPYKNSVLYRYVITVTSQQYKTEASCKISQFHEKRQLERNMKTKVLILTIFAFVLATRGAKEQVIQAIDFKNQ